MNNFKFVEGIGLIMAVVLIAAVILGPWIVIWAWNTLFGAALAIEYSFWTWLAVIILGVYIRSDVKVTKR